MVYGSAFLVDVFRVFCASDISPCLQLLTDRSEVPPQKNRPERTVPLQLCYVNRTALLCQMLQHCLKVTFPQQINDYYSLTFSIYTSLLN